MNNNKKTSLWQLLDKHEIVVPIIQRDYAQGRKGKEDLRYRFLTTLHDALFDKGEAKLDFVYGGVENDQMMPLDGQQRLTTLWLLHWFISFRAGKLSTDNEVSTRLKKFYYATRPSSTEFCRRLVDEFSKINTYNEITGIVEYIKNQHWYYSYYNNDPTIQSILMMIKGDRSKDEKGNEKVINGLEQFFDNNCEFNPLWEKLIADDCPIQFYYKDMIGDDMPIVDDLYVKMNARGKQLTHFENFKAELIGYNQKKSPNSFSLDIVNSKADLDFVSNLDNCWMSVFWPYKHDIFNRVDEIYFKFINQLMLNYYLLKNENKVKIGNEDKEIDKTKLYSLLTDGSKFNKIEDYQDVLDNNFKKMLFNTLNGIEKCASSIGAKNLNDYLKKKIHYYLTFNKNTIDFIPQYVEVEAYEDQDNLPTTSLGQIPQVIFFAICRFFEELYQKKYEWNENTCSTLQDWVRFCYNISYNPLVNTVNGMQSALKVIDDISETLSCLDIYESLCKYEHFDKITLKSKVARDQIEEEYYKAKYQKDNLSLKKQFVVAEQYSFFKGCIRFLLWNENGEYDYNPSSFDLKFNNAKIYFTQDDTLEGKISVENSFEKYFLVCNKLEDIISNDNNGDNCIRFNNTGEVWKYMLTNKTLCLATHRFLICCKLQKEDLKRTLFNNIDNNNENNNKYIDKKRLTFVIDTVLETDFIKNLLSLKVIVSGVLYLRKNFNWALYPKGAKMPQKVIILGTSRNKVLKEMLDKNKIHTDNQVEKSSMFYGWNIPFTYKGFRFVWKWDNKIEYNSDNGDVSKDIEYDIEYDSFVNILDEICSQNNIFFYLRLL